MNSPSRTCVICGRMVRFSRLQKFVLFAMGEGETSYRGVYQRVRSLYGIHKITVPDMAKLLSEYFIKQGLQVQCYPQRDIYDDYSFRSSYSRSVRSLSDMGLVCLKFFSTYNEEIDEMRALGYSSKCRVDEIFLTDMGEKAIKENSGFAHFVNTWKTDDVEEFRTTGSASRLRYLLCNFVGLSYETMRTAKSSQEVAK